MPNAMDPKYQLVVTKPGDSFRFFIYDPPFNKQRVMEYGALKLNFVRVDEDHNISANHEYQTGYKLKLGSAAESEIFNDGADLFLRGNTAAGKIRLQVNGSDFLTLDPVNNSIATLGNYLNYDGTPGTGLYFRSGGAIGTASLLILESGLSAVDQNISRTGANDTGLEFAVDNKGIFNQVLDCNDNLNVYGGIYANKTGVDSLVVAGESTFKDHIRVVNAHNIDMGGGNINEDGSSTKGIAFSSGNINLYGKLRMVGAIKNIELGTAGVISDDGFTQGLHFNAANQAIFDKKINGLQGIELATYCDATTEFRVNGVSGWGGTVNLQTDNTITVAGGMITGKT